MPYGYNGKILMVDLSKEKVTIEQHEEEFYRKYLGGSALGAYYCLREITPKADPLGPDNVIVFAASIITGAPIPCLSRFNVSAKSPLTGGIADSQAGGFWGPELKFAGYDAVVVKGRAKHPVYIWINNGSVEIKDARHVWGMTTGDTETAIREELKDNRIRFAVIGQGGENLVRYACILNERSHANGRTGMGAVMGSKNLKAIAVIGKASNLKYFDSEKVKQLSIDAGKLAKTNLIAQNIRDWGTAGTVIPQQSVGGLPTKNFQSGVFDGYKNITAPAMTDSILIGNDTCYICPIRCKRVVEAQEPYSVDPKYGGPEYETLASLGSYVCVDDLVAIAKANELCNKYSLDTISTGASIAFAMECYDNNILTKEDTDGIDLRFGNADAVIQIIGKIAKRQGFGDVLAEGPLIAAKRIGKGSEKYVMHVKGNPFPAHMPRLKPGMGLIYAVTSFGADHMQAIHDPLFVPDASDAVRSDIKSLGILKTCDQLTLNTDKVRMMYYAQIFWSMIDSLTTCMLSFGPGKIYMLNDLEPMIYAITGWKISSWELMKVGERRINLMRLFNAREGFTKQDDVLPERMYEELPEGPSKGFAINKDEFEQSRNDYYEIAGWDVNTGNPTTGKLKELDIDCFL